MVQAKTNNYIRTCFQNTAAAIQVLKMEKENISASNTAIDKKSENILLYKKSSLRDTILLKQLFLLKKIAAEFQELLRDYSSSNSSNILLIRSDSSFVDKKLLGLPLRHVFTYPFSCRRAINITIVIRL